jgi:L-fuculose-phosphate aldolase
MSLTPAQRKSIDELIAIGRDVVVRQLTLASGGNLSFRDPENSALFFVTAMGTWLDKLTVEDFSHVDFSGRTIDGAAHPSTEWKMHARAYASRSDINSVQHVHPQYSVLIDAMGKEIRLLTLDHMSYVRSVGAVPFAPNASDELGESVALMLLDHDCVVMSNHGCCVVGADIAMAYRRLLNLEEAAANTYRCLVAGDTLAAFPQEHVLSVHS